MGYWLINQSDNGEPSPAWGEPFLELHYGSAVTNSSMIQAGDLQIGPGRSRRRTEPDGGRHGLRWGERLNLQVGHAVPVINSDSRNFEWQVGFRLNYFFRAPGTLPNRAVRSSP